MIEIRHLRAFQAVASELSFRKAAQGLSLAQPALSKTIQDLEHLTGTKLFERSTRLVTLTNAGHVFAKAVPEILSGLENAVRLTQQAQRGAAGELRVGYNDFAINGLLPSIVRAFRAEFPGVTVTLNMMPSRDMVKEVERNRLDAAFHMGPAASSSVRSILVREEHLVAVLPDTHPLSNQSSISIGQLADEKFVMGRYEPWSLFRQLIASYCREHGFDMSVIQEAIHSDGIIGLVAAGLGVTLYVDSRWLHTASGVRVLNVVEKGPSIQTLLTWRAATDEVNPTLKNFLQVAQMAIDAEDHSSWRR